MCCTDVLAFWLKSSGREHGVLSSLVPNSVGTLGSCLGLSRSWEDFSSGQSFSLHGALRRGKRKYHLQHLHLRRSHFSQQISLLVVIFHRVGVGEVWGRKGGKRGRRKIERKERERDVDLVQINRVTCTTAESPQSFWNDASGWA